MSAVDHDELIETLKYTPRRIRLTLWGYGGELVLGTMSREAFDYWRDQGDEGLSDWVLGDMDEEDVPEFARFVESGSWYECDDLAHENGVELTGSSGMVVTDESTGETLFECSLDPDDLLAKNINLECSQEIYAADQEPGTKCYLGQSMEKGLFFEGECTINRPFNPAGLTLHYNEIEGLNLCCGVSYNGQDLDDLGAFDTSGKGMNFELLEAAESDA